MATVHDFPAGRPQTGALNPFHELWNLGYRNLIPIIPPKSPISDRSSIAKRLAVGDDARGKVPGVKGGDGAWRGFDWLAHQTDETDCERWRGMRAGVGVKTGGGLIAIDADVFGEDHATIVRLEIERRFGVLPTRIGRSPKAIYVARIDGPLAYCRVEFGDLGPKGTRQQRVEVLTEGKQFVAYGVHPGTNAPYRWTQRLTPYDELPVLSAESVVEFLDALRAMLPNTGPLVREGGALGEVDQASLAGQAEVVAAAVRALPNSAERFATRESYLSVGYAIKAALPNDQGAAFDLFSGWCDRWTGGRNGPEVVQADWSRMKGPFRRGADFLYRMAEEESAGAFSRAVVWFEPVLEPEPSIFPEEDRGGPVGKFRLEPLADVVSGFDAAREQWLIKKIAPRVGVGVLYGKSGAFKSFVALHMGLSVASGASWAGRKVAAGPVVYIGAEASNGVRKRMSGYFRGSCIDGFQLGGPMHLVAAAPNLGVGTGDCEELVRSVAAVGVAPVLVIIDTAAQTMGGADENGAGMAQYVVNATALSVKFNCLVLVVHHVGLSDDQRLRGHSSLNCAADMQILAERVDKSMETILTLQKLKDDEDDISLRARLVRNVLKLDEDGDEISTLIVRSVEQMREAPESDPDARVEIDAQQAADERLLRAILAKPGATTTDYAAAIGVPRGSLSKRLDRLAKDRLIENVSGKWKATAKTKRVLGDAKTADKDLFS